ncbi:hypothetical protein FPOAC1_003691 [Fusarium poae]|uniref:hypothetical protein n=1 Tax=Fusarium poae TaxID=36050 RepID=UPI001CEAAFAD|nr:hypothetical protein FPOAC1_003691 [Fusarium poae]KAG8677664.1 hypothetical protein FPOAC1_003691 [Fusarium poae]
MVIQEVGVMGVKPGIDIMDPSTPEGNILHQAWSTVLIKPAGPSRVYYGLEEDNPLRIWGFFDWDTVEQHEKFAIEYGADAVKDIPKICTHGEFTKHVIMDPSSDVFQFPVTDVLVAYFPTNFPQAEKDKAAVQLQDIMAKTFGSCSGVAKLAHGWGVENDFPVKREQVLDGQLGAALMGFVGWSVDVMQINDMEGLVSLEIVSLRCKSLERQA